GRRDGGRGGRRRLRRRGGRGAGGGGDGGQCGCGVDPPVPVIDVLAGRALVDGGGLDRLLDLVRRQALVVRLEQRGLGGDVRRRHRGALHGGVAALRHRVGAGDRAARRRHVDVAALVGVVGDGVGRVGRGH